MLIDPWGNPLFSNNNPPPISQSRQAYESPLMANGYDRSPSPSVQAQPMSTPSYRERLNSQLSSAKNNLENLGNRAYSASRNTFGVGSNIPDRAPWNPDAMKSAAKSTAGTQLSPRSLTGAANYGFAGLGGIMNFADGANRGVDFDDNLSQSLGFAGGSLAGSTLGASLGSAAAIPLAAIPVAGPLLSAAAPFLGSAIGSALGGSTGKSVAGGAWDLVDRDDDFSSKEDKRSVESLGDYASFLSPDEQQALGSYLAFSKAQQDLTRSDAEYADAIARNQFREAAKIDFDNNASLETLRSRAAMEQDKQRLNYEMSMANSANLLNAITGNMQSMAALYR